MGPKPALPSLGLCVPLNLPRAGASSGRPQDIPSELSNEGPVLTKVGEVDLGTGTEVRGQQDAVACEL